MLSHRRRLLLIALLLLPLLACGDDREAGLVPLGELITTDAPEPQTLAQDLELQPGAPFAMQVEIDAARFAALEITARGPAPRLQVSWRLAVDRRLRPYRRIDFPLLGSDVEETYRIDLKREAYWTGRVVVLMLQVEDAPLDIAELQALPASSPYRDAAIRGLSVPSLPGGRSLEIPLPDDLPSSARFETLVGLLPEYDRPGLSAHFRVSAESADGTVLWAERTVEGSNKQEGGNWLPLSAEVELPRSGRILLEIDAPQAALGGAVWGDPLLFWGKGRGGPNLVIVLVDTLRRDVLGVYGNGRGLTPELDRLAARSIRFENLFAPSPWTLPSAASLLTGLHPQTHGAGRQVEGYAPTGLTDAPRTLAEVLSAAGFFTVGLYNNIYLNTAFGLQQGFDRYAIHEEKADHLVDRAIEVLEEIGDRRFFFFFHLFDPHNPYEPPAEECAGVTRRLIPDYAGSLACEADRRPEMPLPARADRPWIEALYWGEVAFTDRQIGRFLRRLEELHLTEETIVLFLSDHGEDFWDRLEQQEAYGYRLDGDHGHTHYGELLELPGLLYVPGREPAVVRPAVEVVDLYPTLLALLDVPAPEVQGRDLSSDLTGGGFTSPVLISDYLLYGRSRWSVQEGRWKLVAPHDGEGPLELFDLGVDPAEEVNLVDSHPDVVERLRSLGTEELAHREEARSSLLDEEALGATYLEWRHVTRLRALGYLK